MMKRWALLLAFLACRLASPGQNFEQMSREFEERLKDETVLYGHDASAGKFYDVRGIKMYCETYGIGQPLLMIHGNGGSIKDFMYQIPYFSAKYKVIVADSRSQGRSVDNGDSLTYEMMTDDYAALLDALQIDSAFVLGWSDGGIIALMIAMRYPGKIKKLAITGANLSPDTAAVSADIADQVIPYYTKLKNKPAKSPSERKMLKLLALEAAQPHIAPEELHVISAPSLVIGGDHDILKPAHTLLIFQHIPHAYLWILPNSGHSTPVAYKEEFNKKVDDFFTYPFRRIEKNARGF